MYPAGTVLKLDFGSFFHYGLANGDGKVIHNSKVRKKVTVESYEEFTEGKEIIVSDITSDNLSRSVVLAMRYVGMPYHLLSANCEQFVRLCHGLEIESTQVQQYLLAAFGAGIALKSDNPYTQAAGGAVALASYLTPTEESPFKNAAIAGLIAVGLLALARA